MSKFKFLLLFYSTNLRKIYLGTHICVVDGPEWVISILYIGIFMVIKKHHVLVAKHFDFQLDLFAIEQMSIGNLKK